MTTTDHQGTSFGTRGLDYRTAGVDIEAGEALVDLIKPLAKATTRRGVMGGLGGLARCST